MTRTHYVCTACDHWQRGRPPCMRCGHAVMSADPADAAELQRRREAELRALAGFEPLVLGEWFDNDNTPHKCW